MSKKLSFIRILTTLLNCGALKSLLGSRNPLCLTKFDICPGVLRILKKNGQVSNHNQNFPQNIKDAKQYLLLTNEKVHEGLKHLGVHIHRCHEHLGLEQLNPVEMLLEDVSQIVHLMVRYPCRCLFGRSFANCYFCQHCCVLAF